MKAFFNKIVSYLHLIFGGNLNVWIETHVQTSIDFVLRLEKIIDSPVADLIAALIPGGIGEKAEAFLKNNLGKAIDALSLTEEIAKAPDWTNKILLFTQHLRLSSDAYRNAMLHQLAAELAKISAGGNPPANHDLDVLVSMQLAKTKSNTDAATLPDAPPAAPQQNQVAQAAQVAGQVVGDIAPGVASAAQKIEAAIAPVEAVAGEIASVIPGASGIVEKIEADAAPVIDAVQGAAGK